MIPICCFLDFLQKFISVFSLKLYIDIILKELKKNFNSSSLALLIMYI